MTQTEQLIKTMPTPDLFQDWKLWDERKDYAVARERALRAEIVDRLFPHPKEGSNKASEAFPTVKGVVQVDFTMTHKIDRKVDEALLDLTFAQPELAATSRDRLIKLKPELALKEYRLLDDATRPFFDRCLIVKPGSPQLEFKLKEL